MFTVFRALVWMFWMCFVNVYLGSKVMPSILGSCG